MNILLQVSLDFIALFLVFMVFSHGFNNLNRKKLSNKFFLITCLLTILIILLDLLNIIIKTYYNKFLLLHKITNVIVFLIIPLIAYFWVKFTVVFTKKKHFIKPKYLSFLELPLIINSILCILNFKYDLIFKIDSKNLYSRGDFFITPFVISLLYYSYSFIIIKKFKKLIPLGSYNFFNYFYIYPIIFSLIQIAFPNYLFLCICVALILVFTYILLQQQMLETDDLTGAYNRNFYYHYMNKFILSKAKYLHFAVINIDLDNFKTINDTFGHCTGDRVLKTFVKILKECFSADSFVIRMGGDEFIIILEKTSSIQLNDFIKSMYNKFEYYNKNSNNPYTIKFSCGYDVYSDKYSNINEFLKHVDNLMYKEKFAK